MDHQKVDVVIIGAGAAGLMCAIEAGRRGRRVLLLDHADRPGKKILISGGGRCNFTNLNTEPHHFLSENPHFAKSALARYTPADFVALVEQHSIAYHDKTVGQLFCDHSAQQIVTMLSDECRAAAVQTALGTTVDNIQQSRNGAGFLVHTSRGNWTCNSLVIATGGLSIPKMGATDLGYRVAAQFGIRVLPCRPGLVPLVLSDADQRRWCDLAGLSMEVLVRTGHGKSRSTFQDKLLITHRGLSGPAILQISSYWTSKASLTIDLTPEQQATSPLRIEGAVRTAPAAYTALRQILPARFAERWLTNHLPTSWTNASLDLLEDRLHNWQVVPRETEGYAKAEVTVGGIDTAELDARTMQSRRIPGLYFIGEVVDVAGWLGGYNFQWAWASGVAAGRSA